MATIERRRREIPAGVPSSITATIDEALAGARKLATSIRAAHDSMSAADRAKPAFVGSSEPGEPPQFVNSADDGTAVVYFNPALFDAGSRAASQLLAVSISASGPLSDGLGDKLDHEIDWGALQKIVRP